ncbi:uncharacterized protein LOC128557247 [Mercenaria mercenaria]|uniref:uncharacterized protein LOC128557247 n=1 Tax=Mercenaria mercenaria TaxID=6596 RepID=UPI00234F3FB9|nr:uncharacterized protein LOC128557247 [Mercenaria mercenaria]
MSLKTTTRSDRAQVDTGNTGMVDNFGNNKVRARKKSTPKAAGGDDTMTGAPFRGIARNVFPVVQETFGSSPSAKIETPRSKRRLESAGNRRPPKQPERSHESAVTTDERKFTLSPEQLSELRDDMKTAYEEYVEHVPDTVSKPKTIADEITFYTVKLIGHLRLQRGTGSQRENQQQRELKSSDEDAKKDELSKIKERITKMWESIPKEEMTEKFGKQDRRFTPTEMLDSMDTYYNSSQQKLQWYEQENVCIDKELKDLAEDVQYLTKTRQVKFDENLAGRIQQQQIRHIRLRLESQKRDYLERYEQERACINKELKELMKDIDDLTTGRPIDLSEATDDGIQKEIRNIRSKLDRQKRDFSERQIEMQDEQKWLIDLWTVFSEEEENKKRATSGGAVSKSDLTEMRNNIIQNIKRWKTDRIQVVSLTVPAIQEITKLITNQPLDFSDPKYFDTEKVAKGISLALNPVVTGISWINQCVKENCESFQRKFVRAETYNELKEIEKRLLCEIEDLKKNKDELLNRLSKVAGANLTDNNPNIADLSDPNRASKLAEQYSELYDNPWTDAFEVLETSDERRCIDYLLHIIVESYNICGAISQNQQDVLMRALHSPSNGMTQDKDAKKASLYLITRLYCVNVFFRKNVCQ